MHFSMLLVALSVSLLIRWRWQRRATSLSHRWQHTLIAFLLPPLLLLSTAIAVLWMGVQGQMLGMPVGWLGYLGSIGVLLLAVGWLLLLAAEGMRSLRQIRTYPCITIGQHQGRLLELSYRFAAQIGFWRPQLVISQGLLDVLDAAQLEAVLAHEQAHFYYRDTFWFFWLGWVRRLTAWLPNTEVLWQELLLVRELRADRWAAQQVDPLVLAESLLLVVQDPLGQTADPLSAAFGSYQDSTPFSRLNERIDVILAAPMPQPSANSAFWLWLLLAALPLLTVPLHS